MVDDCALHRAKFRKQIAALKAAAIADLERRGYEVRGKSPREIRNMLRRRPPKGELIVRQPVTLATIDGDGREPEVQRGGAND